MWVRWGGTTEGYWLEMVSGFFPVMQFSEPFPWNKHSSSKYLQWPWAVHKERNQSWWLVTVSAHSDARGPRTHCQVTMRRGKCLSVPPCQGFKGDFSVGTQAHGLH